MYTNYTLEKHLEFTALENSNAKILMSIWQMNKSQLPKAMDAIALNFPNFSLHEKSHCDTIIKNIEAFLGEKRIKTLSPTDTWLILMSSYTHDLGMVVFYKMLEQKWADPEFDSFLVNCTENSFDTSLANSANLILKFQSIVKGEVVSTELKELGGASALKIRNAVGLLNAEYFRKKHHIRSKEVLIGIDKDFERLSNSFYCDQLPNRFVKVLGEVAYGHGINFSEILTILNYQANGYCSDFIHPRFVACMLRLGDILDVDDKRFNMFYLNAFEPELPKLTDIHLKKHAAVEHLLINPKAIEVTLDCPDENSYRISRDWFDWVLEEGKNQTNHWQEIAPADLEGFPPAIKDDKIKVLFKGSIPPSDLLNLKFSISNEKALTLLKGGALYEKTEFVFIREIVQNSLDAIKVQMWKDIEAGIYDATLAKHLKVLPTGNENSHKELLKLIVFPDDLPNDIVENYFIHLKISWSDANRNKLQLDFSDNGCGISQHEIARMSKNVGESKSKEKHQADFITRMPFFLRPTGSFGIGLQSLFLVCSQFKVITKSEGEKCKEIVFRNPTLGNYSSITLLEKILQRGTTISIEIPKKELFKALGNSFSYTVIDKYDYFVDGEGDLFVHKIAEYVRDVMSNVPFIRINLASSIIWQNSVNINSGFIRGELIAEFREVDLLSQLIKSDDEYYFRFVETFSGIGSEIILIINDNFDKIGLPHTNYRINYFVRNIKVESNISNYHRTPYCSTMWNLLGEPSDKLLNVSRDKFQRESHREIDSIYTDKIFPRILLKSNLFVIQKIEQKIKDKEPIDELQVIYFQIALMISNSGDNSKEVRWDLIENLILPSRICKKVVIEQLCTVKDFIELKTPCIILPAPGKGGADESSEYDKIVAEFDAILKTEKPDGLIQYSRFLDTHLRVNYNIRNIYEIKARPGFRLVIFKKIEGNIKEMIEVNKEARNSILESLVARTGARADRRMIYSIKEYAQILAIENTWFRGFEHFPEFSKASIVSPFMSQKNFEFWFKRIKEKNPKKEAEMTKAIFRNAQAEFLPESLINSIIKHSYFKPSNLSREEIVENYISLATEYVHVIWR